MAERHSSGTTPLQTDTRRVLLVKILNMLGSAGTVGTAGGVFSFTATAGTSPAGIVTPTTTAAFAVNTTNGEQWQWYSGSWH